jgi:SulP family sulfate permease
VHWVKDRFHRIKGKGGSIPLTSRDAMAGLTAGIANIPDGMASAVLAGVNPVYGLYTLMVGTPVTALLASTQIMVFNTTSAMTLVAADGLGDRTGSDRIEALIIIALLAGAFQLALGLLGLGMLTRFVSNAVMTGFLTGIAVLIILGQLWDLTGFDGEGGSKLEQTAELLGNLGDIDPWTTLVGIATLVAMFGLQYTRLAKFNLLIALALSLIFVQILELFDVESVALVQSLGEIPRSLPLPNLPEFRFIPAMLLSSVAVAIVGLLQGAGVAQQFPNRDGSEPDDSRDFLAQGAGNVVCGFCQSMPGGGSLSGTSLISAAGARSRWAIVFSAPVVIILVLAFSDLLSLIPMAALAALLIYSASGAIKLQRINAVANATAGSYVTMVVTFLATLVVPLQNAVVLGVVLASVLFIYRASQDIRVHELRRTNGRIMELDPPDILPSDKVTLIDVHGSLFYAGARTLGQLLPDAKGANHAVVILRIRGETNVGSTFLIVLGHYAAQIRDSGGRLFLSGVDPAVKRRMARTGHLDEIGEENVFLASNVLSASTEAAFAAGEAWLETKRAQDELQAAAVSSPSEQVTPDRPPN